MIEPGCSEQLILAPGKCAVDVGERCLPAAPAADTIDLVAPRRVAIEIADSKREPVRLRRIMKHAVLGEMGFFRRSTRPATVLSDGPATLFTLTRAGFDRMRCERPDLSKAFDDFILRILSDRVDFANHALELDGPLNRAPSICLISRRD